MVFSRTVVMMAVLLNVLYFMVAPEPLTKDYGTFVTRTLDRSVVKQFSYFGAMGKEVVIQNRKFESFLDTTVARCSTFTSEGQVVGEGLPYFRIWELLASRVWHNRFVGKGEYPQCTIGLIGRTSDKPDAIFDSVGVWYREEDHSVK